MQMRMFLIAALGSLMSWSFPTFAEPLSSSEILRSLKPTSAPKVRSLGAAADKPAMAEADETFLKTLPTRGLRVEQRQKLAEIAAEHRLPAIDIEIFFDLDSAEITPAAARSLDELGKAIENPSLVEARIALNGHTDASGTDGYNQQLSEHRALAVREYLLRGFAIDDARLLAVGFGEERLKDPAAPVSGINRRVEVVNLTVN